MMTTISPSRRSEIKLIVIEALNHFGDNSLPIKIKALCKSYNNIRLISFSKHMACRNMTYEEVKSYCGTNDSCADYYAYADKYIIYYNDVEKNKLILSNRYRWNIAHELGHILLGHHKKYMKTRIFRSSLSVQEYSYLESEADYFAQLILVPHVVLYTFKVKSDTQIKHLCKISGPASERRFREYSKWQTDIDGNDPYDKPLFKFYYTYLFKKKCKNCDSKLIQRYGKYCPICGHKTLEWGEGTMIYKKLDTYENGKLKECPTCKNEETNIDGSFCQICGEKLINHCSNYNCENDTPLPSNARYCPICGNESAFYQRGILKAWNYDDNDLLINNGFMNIPDSIDEELPFN